MKNARICILVAVAIIFTAIATFAFEALAAPADPKIYDSPQILTDTTKTFVLRDNKNNTETAYDKLYYALESIQNSSGNYTLYLMKDYDSSADPHDNVYPKGLHWSQNGSYILHVRSAGTKAHTLTNTYNDHFTLGGNVENIFENIILDGGDKYGGLTLFENSHATIGDGCIMQNTKSVDDGGGVMNSPILLGDENTKLTIKGNAIIKDNKSIGKKCKGIIFINDSGTVEIDGGSFYNNHGNFGGVISGFSARITINNATFKDNIADVSGAVISAYEGSVIKINNNCVFTENTSVNGGAIFVRSSDLEINNSSFEQNSSKWGAAISSENSDLNINYCTFNNNEASKIGGAIYSYLTKTDKKNMTVNKSKFTANLGTDLGGAICIQGPDATISESSFSNNFSFKDGAAISVKSTSSLTLSESELLENGKAIQNGQTFYTQQGGAIFVVADASVDIRASELKSNTAKTGGAIYTNLYKKTDSDYADTQDGDAYKNLTIDSNTEFSGNVATDGYSVPPLNFEELTNLKFKTNSFTGMNNFNPLLNLDKSLLNNNDVNYDFGAYVFVFDANGGKINIPTGSVETLVERVKPQAVYTIGKNPPVKDDSEFVAWEDEDGKLYQPGDSLPPAKGNHVFKAKWKESIIEPTKEASPDKKIINAPQTGDTSNIALYVVLAVVAMIVFGFIINKNKRKK